MNYIPALPAFDTPDPAHPAVLFSARLDSVLAPLLLLIAAKFRYLGRFTLPLWTRVSRARQRLARLLANLANGRLPRRSPPRPGRKGGAPAPYSPHGNLWLVRVLGYHAAGFGSQLQFLLNDPEFQATLAAAPPSLGRTLRPICRLLGVTLPEPPRLPPRPPKPAPVRAPRQRAPSKRALRAAIPPHQPLAPQRKPRPMPFLNFTSQKASRA